jgi:hypothetical protein
MYLHFIIWKKQVKFLDKQHRTQNTSSQTLAMDSAQRGNHLRKPVPTATILIVVFIEGLTIEYRVDPQLCVHYSLS